MWEINHYVVDKFGLVFQAKWLHIQYKYQHETHGTSHYAEH